MLFQYRLALALGKTRAELLATLTSSELSAWMAFSRIEPIGYARGDLQAAIIASTVANVNRKKPLGLKDFMPDFDKPPENPVKTFRASLQHLVVRKDNAGN